MRRLCSALGVACLLVACAGVARADDRSDARDHFQKGTKFFDLGRFEEAVKEYEAAYEIRDEPVLLYNIAQAHRLAGHAKEAVYFYRSYLRRVPKATNRDEVETKIEELTKLVEQQQKTQTLPPDQPLSPGDASRRPPREARASTTPPPPPPPVQEPKTTPPPPVETTPTPTPETTPAPTPPPPVAESPKPASTGFFSGPGKVKKITGIALLAVGVAGLAVGGAMSALAVGAGNDVNAEAAAGQPFDPSKESTGQTDQVIAGVMYGIGGAAVVAGGVMLYLGIRDDKRAGETHAMVVPLLSPTLAGAAVQIRF